MSEFERVAAQQELQAMVAAYDGSVPFPEFAAQYQQDHPSKYDFSGAAQFIVPPNDPRGHKKANGT